MLPAFRAGSGAQAYGAASTASLTIPATVQTGDLMIAVVTYKLFTGSGTINTPAGWSVLYSPANGPSANPMQGAIFIRRATVSDPGGGLTVTASAGSQQMTIAVAAYVDVQSIKSSSWAGSPSTSSTTLTLTAPTTPPVTGDLVVLFGAVREIANGPIGEPTFTGPAGATIRAQQAGQSNSTHNVASFIGDHDDTAGARTVTASQTSVARLGQIVLAKLASLAPTGTVTLADAVTRSGTQARAGADAVAAADLVGTGGNPVRVAEGTATLAGALAVAGDRSRAVPDAVTAVGTVTRTAAIPRAAAGSVTAGDAVAAANARTRSVAAAVQVAGAVARTAGLSRQFTADEVFLTGTAVAGISVACGGADTLDLDDDPGAGQSIAGTGDDTLDLAGTTVAVTAVSRGVAGAVTAAGAVARVFEPARGVAGAVQLAGVAVAGHNLSGAGADTVTAAGSVARTVARPRGVAGTVTAAGTVTKNRMLTRGGADFLVAAGAVARTDMGVRVRAETLVLAATVATASSDQIVAPSASLTLAGTVAALLVEPGTVVAAAHHVTTTGTPARISWVFGAGTIRDTTPLTSSTRRTT